VALGFPLASPGSKHTKAYPPHMATTSEQSVVTPANRGKGGGGEVVREGGGEVDKVVRSGFTRDGNVATQHK